jgi:hypothetical protein
VGNVARSWLSFTIRQRAQVQFPKQAKSTKLSIPLGSDGVEDTMSEATAKDLTPAAKAEDATFVVKANTEDLTLE